MRFGGQSFLPEMRSKILRPRAMSVERGLGLVIEVDGGENATTAAGAAGAPAIVVAGSAILERRITARLLSRFRARAGPAAATS